MPLLRTCHREMSTRSKKTKRKCLSAKRRRVLHRSLTPSICTVLQQQSCRSPPQVRKTMKNLWSPECVRSWSDKIWKFRDIPKSKCVDLENAGIACRKRCRDVVRFGLCAVSRGCGQPCAVQPTGQPDCTQLAASGVDAELTQELNLSPIPDRAVPTLINEM